MTSGFRNRCIIAIVTVFALRSSAQAASAPLEIPVLLPLTGVAAFIGQAQATSLKVIEKNANDRGGVRGRPVRFVVQDTQTNPLVAVQFANAILAKNAPLLLGPGFTSECLAVAPLIKSGPVDYCLSPALTPSAGSYVYSAGLAVAVFQDQTFRARRHDHVDGRVRPAF